MMFVWGVTDVLQMMGPQLMVFVWGVTDVLQMMGPHFDGVCVGCYRCSPDDGASVL